MDSMTPITELARELWHDDSGQDLVEYALLLVFIALAAIAAVTALGGQVQSVFQDAESQLGQGT